MQYQILALDIDGTLTNRKKEITAGTLSAIMELQKQGVIVVIASGRPVYGVLPIAEALELERYGGYILCFNGGRIFACREKKIIFEQTLPHGYLGKLEKMAKDNQCEIMSYDGNCVITNCPTDPFIVIESRINHLPLREIRTLADYDDRPGFLANKCIVTAEDEHLAAVEPKFQKVFGSKLNIYRSEPFFLEIMPQNVDKAFALAKLLEYLGYTREQLAACGDGYNDLSMIRYAGMGVAMANAQAAVKEAADFITRSNEEDGVAYAIEQLF